MNTFRKIRTLVIDDDYPTPWTYDVKTFLENTGEFEVFCETDAHKAVAFACNLMPDLILVDMSMNIVDGPELLKQMESRAELNGTAFMYCTAQLATGADAKIRHGVQGKWRFFAKDEELDNLLARIANLLLLKHKYKVPTGVELTKS